MFYQFDDDVLSVNAQELNDALLTAGYINQGELSSAKKLFDLPSREVERCSESSGFFYSQIDSLDESCFVKLTIVSAGGGGRSSLALFIKKQLFLVVNIDGDSSNRQAFMDAISRSNGQSITLERLVCNFFDSLIANDTRQLEKEEMHINSLEELVLKNQADKDFNLKLLNMKKKLLQLRGYYEQLIDIAQAIGENENELFSSDIDCLKGFFQKAQRLKEKVDLLRSSVIHLWDAYQAYLDMRLNQTIKVFTLVTTIFFPLTVIVGWYGMNFDSMPELHWKYGYAFVIALSVAVVGGLCLWFKKKRWI